MTYHNFQEKMDGYDRKRVNKFALRLMLGCMFIAVGFFVLIANLVNTILASTMVLFCLFLAITLLDVVVENKDNFGRYENYVKKWWVTVPLCIILAVLGYVL